MRRSLAWTEFLNATWRFTAKRSMLSGGSPRAAEEGQHGATRHKSCFQIRNPRAEIRKKAETRSPKVDSEDLCPSCALSTCKSYLLRVSAFRMPGLTDKRSSCLDQRRTAKLNMWTGLAWMRTDVAVPGDGHAPVHAWGLAISVKQRGWPSRRSKK